ncbi:hypothetical protein [Marinobacter sp. SS21]|uniref:hypothetical protein n=1 Tax=Marinobacter sp. SS21 TaxID=2979460 RepID=UPI00232EF6B6|nr:hypothetical protein [Marinobacter sp. SS21]MDC0662706.1 hypothetical protein [Marinobacter sp. SS21]
MIYRIVTLVGGIVFVAVLFALLWFFCRKFLERHGVDDQVTDRATILATWTFAGISVGLIFAGVGAFVLGPWAFYRTLRGHNVDISDAAAVWWGLAIVAAAMTITGLGFVAFLYLVGAV